MIEMLIIALGLLTAQTKAPLHSALAPDRSSLEAAWDRGYHDARTRSNMDAVIARFQRGLGSANGEVVSFLTLRHPRLVAYEEGFRARKRDIPETAVAVERRAAVERTLASARVLCFQGVLKIMPRNVGLLRLDAREEDLRDVQVDLQVGDRSYSPRRQPGDLPVQTGQGYLEYDASSDDIPRPARMPFEYYLGEFQVEFDLYDPSGDSRIKDKESALKVRVRGHFGRHTATFSLKDLTRPLP